MKLPHLALVLVACASSPSVVEAPSAPAVPWSFCDGKTMPTCAADNECEVRAEADEDLTVYVCRPRRPE